MSAVTSIRMGMTPSGSSRPQIKQPFNAFIPTSNIPLGKDDIIVCQADIPPTTPADVSQSPHRPRGPQKLHHHSFPHRLAAIIILLMHLTMAPT
jgi:hypothetical protein